MTEQVEITSSEALIECLKGKVVVGGDVDHEAGGITIRFDTGDSLVIIGSFTACIWPRDGFLN